MRRAMLWRPPLWLVAILMASTLVLGTGVGYVQAADTNNQGECTESAEVCAKFSNFWKVWNIAESDFLDPSAIKPDDMITGAINGMLDTLNDQGHTRYDTAEQFQREQESLQGEFVGIGAYVSEESGAITVVAPIEGSPAEAVGIQAGDIILSVNGVSTANKTSADVVEEIRGEEGTQVRVEVRHLDEEAPVEYTITRSRINVPAATWAMLPGNVAHIKLSQFNENATPELQKALSEATAAGAQKIIFDLRNNPGGYVHQAVGVAGEFLPEGTVLLRQRSRDGEETVYKTEPSKTRTELPMVVLINSGSASASEILSSALQDHGRAQVIGIQTIGLGTVVQPRELEDGSAVYLGIAEWLTPNGRKLRHEGVTPDITEALPSDGEILTPSLERKMTEQQILQSKDTQLKRALEVLGVSTVAEGPVTVVAR